jgi:hypothetical protein
VRDSKAGAGPMPAGMGARQGRAAKFATASFERLTESRFESRGRAKIQQYFMCDRIPNFETFRKMFM